MVTTKREDVTMVSVKYSEDLKNPSSGKSLISAYSLCYVCRRRKGVG